MSHAGPPPRWRNCPRRGQPVAGMTYILRAGIIMFYLSIAGSPMEALTLTEVASSRLPDFVVTRHYFKIYMSRPLKRQNPVFNFL